MLVFPNTCTVNVLSCFFRVPNVYCCKTLSSVLKKPAMFISTSFYLSTDYQSWTVRGKASGWRYSLSAIGVILVLSGRWRVETGAPWSPPSRWLCLWTVLTGDCQRANKGLSHCFHFFPWCIESSQKWYIQTTNWECKLSLEFVGQLPNSMLTLNC